MKGRDPVFKCTVCGKYISYQDIQNDKTIHEYTPDMPDTGVPFMYSGERTEITHKSCLNEPVQ